MVIGHITSGRRAPEPNTGVDESEPNNVAEKSEGVAEPSKGVAEPREGEDESEPNNGGGS